MATPMKIAVMGAGAVGCYYGGMLARAGHEVTLIGRPAHVEAVARHGLRMQTLAFDEHVPLKADTGASGVRGALWFKLVLNCAYNAISAIARRPYGEMVPSPGIRELMRDVVAECLAVAAADGVQVQGDVDAGVRRIVETMPTQTSSTAQDLARGRPTEIDWLNGFVVRRGEALGVPTPANRALWALVRLLESRPR